MTDRELLEAAAKAAGLDLLWSDEDRPCIAVPLSGYVSYDDWNPLTDDGDALRLAVALNISIDIPLGVGVTFARWRDRNTFELTQDGQLAESVRRAIVRAAAEIGRTT